jgi:hypothetical protein
MQFVRIRRRAGTIVAIALAATAVSAPAASARPIDGPIHQIGQANLTVPPVLPPAQPSELGAAEAQSALAHSYTAPRAARYSSAEFNAYSKPAPIAIVPASKLAAPGDGFHWGDAAIGAGIATAVVLLVTTGTLGVRRRIQLGRA